MTPANAQHNPRIPVRISRRAFLAGSAAMLSADFAQPGAGDDAEANWVGEVAITTSSFSGHLAVKTARGKFTLLQLPRILRDELDMRVIDLNTSTLASVEQKYLEKVRTAAADAGCVLTNLKMNQRGLDMNHPKAEIRNHALTEYKKSIDAASRLGIRWARPLPQAHAPDMNWHIAGYRELADYAGERDVQMLVENYGWMESDPMSVARLIQAVDRQLAAAPDTGNWKNNDVRYAGLEQTFPLAVTCDFKARALGPNGEHPLYDLKRCFEIGWRSGFRGPWCLEHAHADRVALFRELALLRDMLRRWMRQSA